MLRDVVLRARMVTVICLEDAGPFSVGVNISAGRRSVCRFIGHSRECGLSVDSLRASAVVDLCAPASGEAATGGAVTARRWCVGGCRRGGSTCASFARASMDVRARAHSHGHVTCACVGLHVHVHVCSLYMGCVRPRAAQERLHGTRTCARQTYGATGELHSPVCAAVRRCAKHVR